MEITKELLKEYGIEPIQVFTSRPFHKDGASIIKLINYTCEKHNITPDKCSFYSEPINDSDMIFEFEVPKSDVELEKEINKIKIKRLEAERDALKQQLAEVGVK